MRIAAEISRGDFVLRNCCDLLVVNLHTHKHTHTYIYTHAHTLHREITAIYIYYIEELLQFIYTRGI